MRTKPIILNILALIFILIPLSFPLQISYLYGHGLADSLLILNKISLPNYCVVIACLVSSYLLFTSNKLIKLVLPLTLVTVVLNNIYVARIGRDFSMTEVTFASIAFAIVCSALLFSEAQIVIKNQALRWWKVPQRFIKCLPVKIGNSEHQKFSSFDISTSGVFLETKNFSQQALNELRKGARMTVTIELATDELFTCEAEVVRLAESNGSYPQGVGLQFKSLKIKQRWNLIKNISLYKYLGVPSKAHYTHLFM